jgi:hypothetical protein
MHFWLHASGHADDPLAVVSGYLNSTGLRVQGEGAGFRFNRLSGERGSRTRSS